MLVWSVCLRRGSTNGDGVKWWCCVRDHFHTASSCAECPRLADCINDCRGWSRSVTGCPLSSTAQITSCTCTWLHVWSRLTLIWASAIASRRHLKVIVSAGTVQVGSQLVLMENITQAVQHSTGTGWRPLHADQSFQGLAAWDPLLNHSNYEL